MVAGHPLGARVRSGMLKWGQFSGSVWCSPVHFFAPVSFSGSHVSCLEALDNSPVRFLVTHLYNIRYTTLDLLHAMIYSGKASAGRHSVRSRARSRVLPRKMAANSELLDDESMSALPTSKKAKKETEDPSLVVIYSINHTAHWAP